MAKIATAAGAANQVVGKVFILYGKVQAVAPDGTVRILAPNSPIYANERIITGSDGSVSIQFDGPPVTQLDLGRMTEIVVDEDVYAGVAPEAVSEAAAQAEQVQQSLLEGDQPIDLEATAAGGAAGAGGGHPVVNFALDGSEVTVGSGADTSGIDSTTVGTLGSVFAPAAPIADGMPTIIATSGASVDETGGLDTVTGTLAFDYGADGPGTIVLSADGATWNAATLTLTADDGTWQAVVNGDGATYTFTQLKAMDHPSVDSPVDSNEFIPINITATVTDADGDSVSQVIVVNVYDDGPSIGDITSEAVHETQDYEPPVNESLNDYLPPTFVIKGDGALDSATGTIPFSFGEDGPGSIVLSVDEAKWPGAEWDEETSTLSWTADGDVNPSWTIVLIPETGGDTYTYNFTLLQALDHLSENNEDKSLNIEFTATVTDHDGDFTSGSFNVTVYDDVPELKTGEDGSDTITVEEESVPDGKGGVIGNDETGDGYSYTKGGTIFDNVNWGADGFGKVTGVSAAGQPTAEYDGEAHTYTIETDGYKMVVEEGGAYTFTLKDNTLAPGDGENISALLAGGFTISAQDADGDPVAGGITVNVNVVDDVSVANDDFASATEGSGGSGGGVTNLLLILDVSESMQDNLTEIKNAVSELVSAYDDNGGFNLKIVTFANTANEISGVFTDVTSVETFLEGLSTSIWTNYEAGITTAMAAWDDAAIDGATPSNSIAYFISDGDPNRGHMSEVQSAWQDYVGDNFSKAIAIGIGIDAPAADGDLQMVAHTPGGADEIYVVADLDDLTETLVGTVPVAPGTVIGGKLLINDFAGADGFGSPTLVSVEHASLTEGKHAFLDTGDSVTITLGAAGSVKIYGNGTYDYTAGSDVASPDDVTAEVKYTIQDGDGDPSTATLYLTTTDRSEVTAYDNLNQAVLTTVIPVTTTTTELPELDEGELDTNGGASAQAERFFTVESGTTAAVNLDIDTRDGFKSADGDLFTWGLYKQDGTGNWSQVETHDQNTSATGDLDPGNYKLFFETQDNSSTNGHEADVHIDEIRLTTSTPNPDLSYVVGEAVSGNVITDETSPTDSSTDDQGSEGATLHVFDGSVFIDVAAGTTIDGDYGTLVINPDGSYTYTPEANILNLGKEDTFTYELVQPDGDSSTADLVIKITAGPDDNINLIEGTEFDDHNSSKLEGTDGDDLILGLGGNDELHGNDGNDRLDGGAGNDMLKGGDGDDLLTGGTGADTFKVGEGHDTITDYNKGEGDKVDISDVIDHSDHSRFAVESDGGKAKLVIYNDDAHTSEKGSVTFDNIDFNSLTPGDQINSLLGQVDLEHD